MPSLNALAQQLCEAAGHGDLAQVRSLLDRDARLVGTRHVGATPLHYAALHGQASVADLLIARGAELDARDDEFDSPPIGWANEKGCMDLVAQLDARGAPVSPWLAAAFGLRERLREHIAREPGCIDQGDANGTPLHAAALWGQEQAAEYLLSAGANPRLLDRARRTPEMIARIQAGANARLCPIVAPGRRAEIVAGCARIAELLQARAR